MLRVVVLALGSVALFVVGATLWGVAGEAMSRPAVIGAMLSWLGAILAAFDSVIGALALRRKRADLPAARVVR